jgi:hypothetical protein
VVHRQLLSIRVLLVQSVVLGVLLLAVAEVILMLLLLLLLMVVAVVVRAHLTVVPLGLAVV